MATFNVQLRRAASRHFKAGLKRGVGDIVAASDASRFRMMLQGYVEAALWLGTKDMAEGIDGIDLRGEEDRLLARDVREMANDVAGFLTTELAEGLTFADYLSELSTDAPTQAGHDFYLTRNGHGSGFWDDRRGLWGDYANKLSAACDPYGSQSIVWHHGRLTVEPW